MDDEVEGLSRGASSTLVWESHCKDCQAERRGRRSATSTQFQYSGNWAARKVERGQSRSDRCERHRQRHAQAIKALAVPYIDLKVIGEVPDPRRPTGPLGGLGPLPVKHTSREQEVALDGFEFGMSDLDILKLLEGLSHKRVAVVEAGTGTGKSTFMPFRLMNPPSKAALHLTRLGPIVVTEPRRAAATRVARFVGEELCFGCDSRTCNKHIGPGFPVGYQVHGVRQWDAACDLIYVTDGTMINWIRDGHLARIGTVIIDEAHERSENIDTILVQLRDQVSRSPHLRVIITSATLDRDFFVSYFGGADAVFQMTVPPKKTFGYGVPLFLDADIGAQTIQEGMSLSTQRGPVVFSGWPQGKVSAPDGNEEDLQAITRMLATLPRLEEIPLELWARQMPERVAKQAIEIAAANVDGDILAFLPTSRTIHQCIDAIEQGLKRRGIKCDVYPLLSTTPEDISSRAISARRPGARRKIVVSSNLAETSLTVRGVRFVIDSGLICQQEWDPQIASSSFPTKFHSQSGLRQRWGRVGRDSPGWVFPLYTTTQFLSLPLNTPPESAQTNLESFHMKLVAAGLQLDDVVAPGAFGDPDSLDDDGRRYAGIFKAESERALRALKKMRALDADGDLTHFGRELERYPGDGGGAVALMLADQLACVHEVSLALTALGQGRLIGTGTDCILRWDRNWPLEWRLRAAQCHRGLAIGCSDDLDVLLRVVALWQASDRRSNWCRQWWINESALLAIWEEVVTTVDSLSAAMKADAIRDIDPRLAARARGALTSAMVEARYRRVDCDAFVAEESADAEPEEGSIRFGRLMEPADRIMAFHRYRPTNRRNDTPEPPILSHIVNVASWAEFDEDDPELVGLQLVLRASTLPAPEASHDDALYSLLTALPIGAVVSSDVSGSHVRVVSEPFSMPLSGGSQEQAGLGAASGFDRDWDLLVGGAGNVPEEDSGSAAFRSAEVEANGPLENLKAPPSPRFAFDAGIYDKVEILEHLAPAGSSRPRQGVVVGYTLQDSGRVGLLVDPLPSHVATSDPTAQPPVKPWQEVECTVSGIVCDHERELLQVKRTDNLGQFLIDIAWNPGVDDSDRGFLRRLARGARFKAHALPQPTGLPAVTFLPDILRLLAKAPTEDREVEGVTVALNAATIVEGPDQWGWCVAELDCSDADRGVTFRFRLRRRELEGKGIRPVELGTRLLLAHHPDRSPYRLSLTLDAPRALEIARRNERIFEVSSNVVKAREGTLNPRVISELVGAGASVTDSWEFYNDSLHRSVVAVAPIRPSRSVAIPRRLFSLFAIRRQEFQSRWNVELHLRSREAQLLIQGDDQLSVDVAVEGVRSLAVQPRRSAKITPDMKGFRSVEARAGVLYLWTDRHTDEVTVIATDQVIAETALNELFKPVQGMLTIPEGWTGRFIGKDGENLRALRNTTGCEFENVRGDPNWYVRGADLGSLYAFFELARSYVPSASTLLLRVSRVEFTADEPDIN